MNRNESGCSEDYRSRTVWRYRSFAGEGKVAEWRYLFRRIMQMAAAMPNTSMQAAVVYFWSLLRSSIVCDVIMAETVFSVVPGEWKEEKEQKHHGGPRLFESEKHCDAKGGLCGQRTSTGWRWNIFPCTVVSQAGAFWLKNNEAVVENVESAVQKYHAFRME